MKKNWLRNTKNLEKKINFSHDHTRNQVWMWLNLHSNSTIYFLTWKQKKTHTFPLSSVNELKKRTNPIAFLKNGFQWRLGNYPQFWLHYEQKMDGYVDNFLRFKPNIANLRNQTYNYFLLLKKKRYQTFIRLEPKISFNKLFLRLERNITNLRKQTYWRSLTFSNRS